VEYTNPLDKWIHIDEKGHIFLVFISWFDAKALVLNIEINGHWELKKDQRDMALLHRRGWILLATDDAVKNLSGW